MIADEGVRRYDAIVRKLLDAVEVVQDVLDADEGDAEFTLVLDGIAALLAAEADLYRPRVARPGQLYFIQAGAGGPIKIGFSVHPAARLRHLQTANPEPLRLLGAVSAEPWLEQRLHGELDEHRLEGEWFAPHADVWQTIALYLERAS